MQKIFTTVGSKGILKQVIKENQERRLYLYQGNQDYQLVDPDSNDSIFKIPIKYDVAKQYGEIDWRKNKNVTTLIVNDDEKKLLIANIQQAMTNLPNGMLGLLLLFKPDNENQITITSFWNQLNDFHTWIHSDSTRFLTKYQNDPSSNYYTIDYQPTKD